MQYADQGKDVVVYLQEIELVAVKPVKIKDDQDGKKCDRTVITGFPKGYPFCGGGFFFQGQGFGAFICI
jgi:hypothetical protein